jgi:hypothetical protein
MNTKCTPARWIFPLIALGTVASTAPARAQSSCDAVKLTALGRKASQNLLCQAKAAGRGRLLDPNCRVDATATLANGFEKAVKKGDCLTSFGDASTLGGLLDRYAARFDAGLRPAIEQNKCAKKKLIATGKDALARFACESRATRKGVPVDLECVTKASTQGGEAFAKAESKPPCLTSADFGTNDALVSEAVACVRAPSVATCPAIVRYTLSLVPGTIAGYVPLDALGVMPTPIGDEQIINFITPPFVYNGLTYDVIGVDSNGYVVAGGGDSADNNCCNPALPSTARPNNILAPFWTDLDGTGAPGIFLTTVTDGVNTWIVVEWRLNVFGTTSQRTFQLWIGIDGVQDIAFAYPSPLANPNGQPLYVGAEVADGSTGATLGAGILPAQDLRVTSSGTL